MEIYIYNVYVRVCMCFKSVCVGGGVYIIISILSGKVDWFRCFMDDILLTIESIKKKLWQNKLTLFIIPYEFK